VPVCPLALLPVWMFIECCRCHPLFFLLLLLLFSGVFLLLLLLSGWTLPLAAAAAASPTQPPCLRCINQFHPQSSFTVFSLLLLLPSFPFSYPLVLFERKILFQRKIFFFFCCCCCFLLSLV
jgi:hypothetical protein